MKQQHPEVMADFAAEAAGYFPQILSCLHVMQQDPSRPAALSEAFRLVHNIKGTAAMLKLKALSHTALYTEETLVEAIAGGQPWTEARAELITGAVLLMQQYVENVLSQKRAVDYDDELSLLVETVPAFRRFRGLPEDGDQTEITDLLPVLEAPPMPALEDEEEEAAPRVSASLLESFRAEAEEHLQVVAARLREMDGSQPGRETLLEVRRSVHTLKGAASVVGMKSFSRLSHRMEDLLDQIAASRVSFSADIGNLLLATSDALEDLTREDGVQDGIQGRIKELYGMYTQLLSPNAMTLATISPERNADTAVGTEEEEEESASPATSPKAAAAPQLSGQYVRVPIERLDELVRLVGELVVNRSTFERHFSAYWQEIGELGMSAARLRKGTNRLDTEFEATLLGGMQVLTSNALSKAAPGRAATVSPMRPSTSAGGAGQSDFDALEFDRYTEFHLISRDLTEVTGDIHSATNRLGDLGGDFDSSVIRMGQLTSEVQDKMMRLRMVPLSSIATRLHRTVRVAARAREKQAELEIIGSSVEVDKSVLEQMTGPLEHILRNGVDHGIESPQVRRAKGKPERGRVILRAYHEGTQIVIEVRDDGAGLDLDKLRATIVNRGLASEADVAAMNEETLYSYAFEPGFSTSSEITEISGRGIGLDVLRTMVHRLKGTLRLSSTPGRGTTFTIRLPLSLAVTRVLLVRANQRTYAVPLGVVKQVLRIEWEQLEHIGTKPVLRLGQQVLPVVLLSEALHLPGNPDRDESRIPILVMQLGDKQVGLAVDRLLEAREVAVKTLGELLQRARGFLGATLLGDGEVVLIVDPAEIVEEPAAASTNRPAASHAAPSSPAHRPVEVLIVDDSLSVRRVLSDLARDSGWVASTAKDGVEALEALQRATSMPDVILLDIEMPRMDGYELTSTLRSNEAYKDIPVVMLTSRSGEKHRRKALSLGVTEYMVKPYQEETLVSTVRTIARDRRERRSE